MLESRDRNMIVLPRSRSQLVLLTDEQLYELQKWVRDERKRRALGEYRKNKLRLRETCGRPRFRDEDGVVQMRSMGVSADEIARHYNISRSTVFKILKRRQN